jgi:hypothetical protein
MNFNYYWTADGWSGDRDQWDASGAQDWTADGFIAAYFLSVRRSTRRRRR